MKIIKIMKRFNFLYFIAVVMLSIVGKTQANEGITPLKLPIVLMGSFDDKLTYQNLMHTVLPRNRQWLGLFCKNKVCEVKPAQVKVSDHIEKWELNGESVTSDKLEVKGKPLAVFLGVPNIKVGKVATYSFGSDSINTLQLIEGGGYADETINKIAFYRQLHSKKGWKIPSNNTQSMTLLREVVTKKPTDKNLYIEDISILKLNSGLNTQVLLKTDAFNYYGVSKLPLIDWIGDLDNDSKIDILLSIVTECGYDYRLFLSSLANVKKGELIHNTAKTQGELMRCGC